MTAPSPTASPASIITSVVNNFKPDAAVWAGGGAAVLTLLLGAVLVGAGVVIPPISILGVQVLATATPLTMAMFTAAGLPIGHIVTSYVPPSYNQALDQFAKKIGADVDSVRTFVPQIQQQFPADPKASSNVSNINTGGQ